MIIALDYDGTYTADPVLWDKFILLAKENNHYVICCTLRHFGESKDVLKDLNGKVNKICFTARRNKKDWLKENGIIPDIWIDDNPAWIFQDAAY